LRRQDRCLQEEALPCSACYSLNDLVLTWLKIKNLTTAKEMWDVVITDTITKSMLFLIDMEDQLATMQCHDDPDMKTHYADLQGHFELMV